MKKLFITTALLATIGLGLTGCLKDKGFESNQYGINNPAGQPVGIGFPWAYLKDVQITSVSTSSTSQTIQTPPLILAGDQPAAQDIVVNVQLNQALVDAYNQTRPPAEQLAAFPAGAYSIPNMKITIPKGSRLGFLSVTVPNANNLDLSKVYGLGLTITSVETPGITIAENLKNLVIGINVKNQYDGFYEVHGYFFHPAAPRAINMEKRIRTVSANGCRTELGDLGGLNYLFDFEVVGSNLTNWVARGDAPPAPASGFMTTDVPNPGGITYPGAQPGQAPWLHSTYNNTYNASTRTFYMHYGYGGGASSQNGYSRQVYEDWHFSH